MFLRPINRLCLGAGLLLLSGITQATTVQFQTSMGDFEVNLYDQTTPATVANFLAYVEDDAYTNSVIHRSVAGFVVQGGGFQFNNELPLERITTMPPVLNEPELSNRRATIAMAKLGGDPNSATSQWFFNLADNSANLDAQNGGFTVFGEVMADGMDVIDAMAALPTYTSGSLTNIPLMDYDPSLQMPPEEDQFIQIYSVTVIDPAADTAANSNPTPNTLINQTPPPKKKKKKSGMLGGDDLLGLLLIGLGGFWCRRFSRLKS